MAESDVVSSQDQTIKQRIFSLLEKNHDLMPLTICKLLDLPKKSADYVGHKKTEWKHDFRNRLPLKCLKFHRARGWIHALKIMDREAAVGVGWLQSKARNGMLVWNRDPLLGRLEWFRTGRINEWIRRPATKGKALELLAKAFSWTKLIPDMNVFAAWAATLRFKGSHLTFDTGEKVPYAMIDFLKESNGVVFRAGDISDPTKYELEFHYPDWAERNELLFTQITKFLQDLSAPRSPPKNDRSVV